MNVENLSLPSPLLHPKIAETLHFIKAKGFPNRNDPIDINRMKFVPDQQENELDGVVHLITDKDKVEQLQVLIGTYARGCNYLFAAMWPVSLCTDNIDKITNEPYAIAVKPAGQLYLLYVDPNGRMYFENTNQNFFQVIQGIPTTNTLLDGILTRRKPKRSTETLGQLTFVIQDAIRCNGRDLRSLTILERIAVVKQEIMEPMKYFVNPNRNEETNGKEILQFDLIELKDVGLTKELISSEFQDKYQYPIKSLLFYPHSLDYKCSASFKTKIFMEWIENDNYECSFRLKLPQNLNKSKLGEGILLACGAKRIDSEFASIDLTEELVKLDGQIIDCYFNGTRWIFKKLNTDRTRAHTLHTIKEKLHDKNHRVSRHHLLTWIKKKMV